MFKLWRSSLLLRTGWFLSPVDGKSSNFSSSSLLSKNSSAVMEKLDEQHKAVIVLMSNLGQSGAMVHRIDAGIAKLQEIAKGNQLPTRQNDDC
jgi:hypothetical protein